MAITLNRPGVPRQYQLTSVTTTDWIQLKTLKNPFETSIAVYVESPSGFSAKVEYTNHPDPDSAPAVAIRDMQFVDENSQLQTQITDALPYLDGPLEWPVQYVRLSYLGGTGTATLNVFQSGTD